MRKFSLLIILSLTLNLYSQEQYQTSIYFCSVVGGINSSTFLNTDSNLGNNYTFGIYFKKCFEENFALLPMFTYSKHSFTVNRLEGKFSNEEYVYKTNYDLAFETSFIDLNLLCNYNMHHLESMNFNFGVGIGYSIGLQDHSKSHNIKITDQIIGEFINSERSVAYGRDPNRFSIDNNGFIVSTNFNLNYKRINLTLMYSLKLFKVKEIDNIQTVTFLLGFFIL